MGAAFMVIPMLGDSILRGLGDTFTPAFVMMTAALLNVVLDPLLIFGIGPFPALGVEGAAIATVISRGITAIVSILIQAFREHLLTIPGNCPYPGHGHTGKSSSTSVCRIPQSGQSVRWVQRYSLPFFPVFGHEVVAGYGVATKIESVFLAIINAFSITATVFVGQNLGAGNGSRVRRGIRFLDLTLLGLGLFIACIFFFSGNIIAGFFNEDPVFRSTTAIYLKIVPLGYGFLALTQVAASILNVYHKPYMAGGLSLFQIGIIAVPGVLLLSGFFGVTGVFAAILSSFVIAGLFSVLVLKNQTAIHVPN